MRAIKGKDLKEKRRNEERPGAAIQGSSPREGEERKQLYWASVDKTLSNTVKAFDQPHFVAEETEDHRR